MAAAVYVGIDVSKAWLDIAVRPSGDTWRAPNTDEGTTALAERLGSLGPTLVVLEGTGGLERLAAGALAAVGLPVALVNPRQARDFARGTGRLAKTDRIDAAALAHFAEAVQPEPKPLPEAQAAELKELIVRRRQLIALRVAEHNRRDRAASPTVRQSLHDHVEWLESRLSEADREIEQQVRQSPLWRTKENLLRSVPGVGPVLAAALLVDLPELGQIAPKPLAALVGVAPHSRDSGRRHGPRHVAGGRARLRAAL